MGTLETVTFATAFLFLAILAAKNIYLIAKPPRHRPFLFFVGGMFIFFIGVGMAYSLHADLDTGVIIHNTRRLYVHVELSVQPIKFWITALAFYTIAIFMSGVGLVSLAFCFRKYY